MKNLKKKKKKIINSKNFKKKNKNVFQNETAKIKKKFQKNKKKLEEILNCQICLFYSKHQYSSHFLSSLLAFLGSENWAESNNAQSLFVTVWTWIFFFLFLFLFFFFNFFFF